MADEAIPAIGMSVGATTLAAVTADHAVTRRPVLTLYQDHSAQVGLPSEASGSPEAPETSESSGPEQGLVITDFVNRVGDSAPLVAPDGSARRGEQVLADALHSLAYVATEGHPLPAAVAVSHPAHWSTATVDALSAALSRVPQWAESPLPLISDVATALTALKADPGLPGSGILAVCDFGGTGTSITLVDAGGGYQPVGTTVRYTDFSGEAIDQALLNYVVADLTANGSLDDASKIRAAGSLTRLRGQCRSAKERLSTDTVTEVTLDLPGFRGETWVTRAELDEVIRQPFEGVIAAVLEAMDRRKIPAADLVTVAAVGGGANIPAVTAGLSQQLGVPLITVPRPQLAAAIGAALRVAGSAGAPAEPTPSTPPTPPAPPVSSPVPPPQPAPAGWRQPDASVWRHPDAQVRPEPAGQPEDAAWPPQQPAEPAWPQPQPQPSEYEPVTSPEPVVDYEPFPDGSGGGGGVWSRRPLPVILGVALAVLLIGVVAVIALRHAAGTEPAPPAVTPEPTEPAGPAAPTPHELPTLPSLPALPPLPSLPPLPEVPAITPMAPGPESQEPPESPETPESPGTSETP